MGFFVGADFASPWFLVGTDAIGDNTKHVQHC